ncbi:MAG: hypothetical protein K0B02_02005 [DPANN group archaeon]|nr:hypothetical protein [DPANN group archaeon]
MEGYTNIIDELRQFGFTQYESKAYITLISKGVLSGPDISKFSKIPKSKIYDVVNNLLTKRMIEEFPGTPRKFKARAIDNVFNEILTNKKEKIDNLEKTAETLKTRIKGMLKFAEKTYIEKNSVIWTVDGRKAFHEKFAEMGDKSTKEVFVITPYFSRNPLIERSIEHAKTRGVTFQGITSMNDENKDRIRFYTNLFDNISVFNGTIPMTIIIIDDKECIYRMEYKSNGQNNYIGVHSTNPGLINAFKQYWDGLIKDSNLIEDTDLKIDQTFLSENKIGF